MTITSLISLIYFLLYVLIDCLTVVSRREPRFERNEVPRDLQNHDPCDNFNPNLYRSLTLTEFYVLLTEPDPTHSVSTPYKPQDKNILKRLTRISTIWGSPCLTLIRSLACRSSGLPQKSESHPDEDVICETGNYSDHFITLNIMHLLNSICHVLKYMFVVLQNEILTQKSAKRYYMSQQLMLACCQLLSLAGPLKAKTHFLSLFTRL